MCTMVKSAMIRTNLLKKRPAPSVMYMPGLSSPSANWTNYMQEKHGEVGEALQANYKTILNEYHALQKSVEMIQGKGGGGKSDYPVDDAKLHTGEWDWQSYVQKGERKASFSVTCPKTTEILESFHSPKLMTGTPLSFAFFSTMGAGAEIKPHFGPSNLRIRCHFPLLVPSGDLGMEIGGLHLKWKEGRALFFDDSYEHRVWNHSSGKRVVLLFDLWHPELENEEIETIQDMFGFAKEQGWGSGSKSQ